MLSKTRLVKCATVALIVVLALLAANLLPASAQDELGCYEIKVKLGASGWYSQGI